MCASPLSPCRHHPPISVVPPVSRVGPVRTAAHRTWDLLGDCNPPSRWSPPAGQLAHAAPGDCCSSEESESAPNCQSPNSGDVPAQLAVEPQRESLAVGLYTAERGGGAHTHDRPQGPLLPRRDTPMERSRGTSAVWGFSRPQPWEEPRRSISLGCESGQARRQESGQAGQPVGRAARAGGPRG
eukprot:7383165-Prymnesium_polylepis.5